MSRLLSPVYLLLLACAYFYTVLDGNLLLTERDLAVFFIPPRILWTGILGGGEFPLWNPLSYCGHPLLATLQPGIFYPVNLLLLILPFDLGFNWIIVLHYFLAGLFMLLLLKELGVTRSGRLAGAITFMLCGYLFSVHNVLSTLLSVTWVPLALFFYLKALRSGSFRQAAYTGIVMVIIFTGGGIEVLLGTFGLLLITTLLPGLFDFSSGPEGGYSSGSGGTFRHNRSYYFMLFLSTALLFVLLSAVQLLPFLELASQSTRSGGLSYFEATTWSFDLKDFLQFLIPDLYGYGATSEKYWANQSWLKTVYTGTLPLILALFFFLRFRGRTLLFLFVAIIFFMLALGKNSLIYPYLYEYMPFFSKIRYPVKFLFVPSIFLAIAAGLGLDSIKELLTQRALPKRMLQLLLFFVTLTALFFGYLSFFQTDMLGWLVSSGYDFPEYNYAGINLFNTKRLLFFIIIELLGLYAAFRVVRLRPLLPFFFILVLSIDLFFAHNNYYGSTPSAEYHSPGEVIQLLKRDESLFRVFVTPKTLKEGALMPVVSTPGIVNGSRATEGQSMSGEMLAKEKLEGYNLEHGIYDISGVNVMKRVSFAELYELMAAGTAIDSTNLLSMMNVKYVVSTPLIESDEFKLLHVVGMEKGAEPGEYEEAETVKVYENLKKLPRFYLVEDFSIVEGLSERLSILFSKNFLPSESVVLEENPWSSGTESTFYDADAMPEGAVEAPEVKVPEVKVTVMRANSIELDVTADVPSILVTSESWYPGWKVYVDGKREKVLKANHAFRAVAVRDGKHTVRFVYSPITFTLGAIVSGVTLFGLLVCLFYINGRRRKRA